MQTSSGGVRELSKDSLKEIAAQYRAASGRAGAFSSFVSGRIQSGQTHGSINRSGDGYADPSRVPPQQEESYKSKNTVQPDLSTPSAPSSGESRKVPPGSTETLHTVENIKAEGTALFQAGKYFEAYEVWKTGIDALEGIEASSSSEDAKPLAVALCCNSAQALLKCPEVKGAATEMAASLADRALMLDPSNVKALFRRGCAYRNAQGWLLARKDFEQVLRLDPTNEAAMAELSKMEDILPPASSEVLSRRSTDDVPVISVPRDPESAVRMAQKEAERFRREVLSWADRKGCVTEWCRRFNKIQVTAAEWAKHQLADPEILQDLLILRGPLFQAMNFQQREDFLCAYDFVEEVKQRHGDEIAKLAQE